MKGRVFLIKKGVGKIIIGNDETPIMDLPISFDNGDIVEVEFINNDITKKPYKLIAYSSKRYYGFVIQEFNPQTGIILPTYPEIATPVLYERIALKKRDKVSFIIQKENDKLKAINIKLENSYKCETPIFGVLEKKVIIPKEGVVTEIVKEIIPKEQTIKGNITYLNRSKNFGFISNQTYQRIFFSISWFKGFYKREPKEGEEVNFFIKKTDRGLNVSRFSNPTKAKVLSKNEQYFIINSNIKMPLYKYINLFNQEPLIGDIVYFYENELKKDNSKQEKIIFKTFDNVQKGKVKVIKEKFGFISTENKDVFFFKNQFVNFYKKEPKRGDIVYFTDTKTDRGYQITSFKEKEIEVEKKEFVNFAEIEDSLYFAYISNSKKEIFKYNPDNLSHALSCYNTKNIPDIYKLQAINTLLKLEYTNKRISKEKLINQKKAILNRLKNQNIDYIVELQKIDYNPSKIDIPKNPYKFIELKQLKEINFQEKIAILNSTKIKELKYEDKYLIIPNQKLKEIKLTEPKWQIKELK